MRLHRVRLVNFRQYADTEILLGPGLTAIIGPNGSGKTTILEAIAWAFYGTPATRGPKDSIRRDRAPARAQVQAEVDFTLGAHDYKVVRGLHKAELYQDRGSHPIVNSQQEVTSRMGRLLGMTREEFFNTYFTGQKELAVMAAMGPADRGRFLSRMLNYEKLKFAQDRVRDQRSTLKAELGGLEAALAPLADLEREKAEAEQRLKTAKAAVDSTTKERVRAAKALEAAGPAWTGIVELRERVHSMDGDRRVAEHHVVEAKKEFERLDLELREALDAKAALTKLQAQLKPVAALRKDLERLDREARAAGERRTLSGQRAESGAQASRAQVRLKEMGDVEKAVDAARKALEQARHDLSEAEATAEQGRSDWVRDRQDAKTKLTAHVDQYKDLESHLKGVLEAGPEGTCPTCTRPLREEFDAVVAELQRQLEEVKYNGKFFRQRVRQLENEPKALKDADRRRAAADSAREKAARELERTEIVEKDRKELVAEVKRLFQRCAELDAKVAALPDAYDEVRHDEVRDRLKELEPAVANSARLQVRAERAERLVSEAERAEKVLSERETRAKQLAAVIADLGFNETKYLEARKRYEVADAAARDLEVRLASLFGDVKTAEAAVAAALKRLAERVERQVRVDALRFDVRLHDALDSSFHDLRDQLNSEIRPELAEIASGFLDQLTDGRYDQLELDEEYRLTLSENNLRRPVISGGEDDVANLALRLAISQRVADRAGQPLTLLVLDEIFGSLDELRRQNVIELLRRLADRFPQVILITHIEDMWQTKSREYADRVLSVSLDPETGIASVSENGGGPDSEDVAA